MTNRQVVEYWMEGVRASSSNMRTDGRRLFSYQLRIGFTDFISKLVVGFTMKDGISRTTNSHISLAYRASGLKVPPTRTDLRNLKKCLP
jgi:hypothetical protein